MTVEEKAKYDELMRSGLLKVREAAARTQIASNFRQICGALHTYAGQYNSFPSHAIYGKDDKTPLLSWRVAILPFLEQGALYNQFKLDERWDSEHNKKLISRMPQCFALPGAEKEVDGLTFYQVFTGPATVFDGPKKMKWNEITNGDGISNTLLLVHASEPVIWTKPADLLLPQVGGKMPALGGLSKDSTQIAWCDGTTSSIPRSLDPATLRAIVTPNGKEVVDRNKIGK
jgi:hypothetical protein